MGLKQLGMPSVVISPVFPRLPSSLLYSICVPPANLPTHVRVNGCTVAGPSVSSEADGALAGELGPWARATGCVGVTPMTADVARILKGVGGAICEGGDIETP